MQDTNRHIIELLYKRLSEEELDTTEMNLLQSWLTSDVRHQELYERLQSGENLPAYLEQRGNTEDTANAYQVFVNKLPELQSQISSGNTRTVHKIHFLRRGFLRYAAAILILAFGAGAYLWITNKKKEQPLSVKNIHLDVAPGHDGAILTLADGRQVVLDSLGNGMVAIQNGTQVLLKNGLLTYDPTGKSSNEVLFNTMSTPKGRQYQLVLPDGTNVWLNAASSIRYPTIFNGKDRTVEIDGEAYFEVASNPKMPFKVKINKATEVEVLGTHFNINAYKNEVSIKTTLLEGSIKVKNGDAASAILRPGQQAVVESSGNQSNGVKSELNASIKIINAADIEKTVAWKNGLFNFEDASLEDVMRQLSRWYDLEVVYEKGIPNIVFAGKMRRDVSLAGVLKGLKGANVNFRLEKGKRLVVIP